MTPSTAAMAAPTGEVSGGAVVWPGRGVVLFSVVVQLLKLSHDVSSA